MLKHLYRLNTLFFSCCIFACFTTAFAFDYGDPSSLEQAQLEVINRARLNPLQEAQRLGIDLFEGVPEGILTSAPKQPLSFNISLQTAARNHSLKMLNENYFAHNNPAGQSPFDRISSQGYDYRYATENIAMSGLTSTINDVAIAQSLHDDLFIDRQYQDRSHRTSLLDPNFREIGIGLAFGIWHDNGNHFNTVMLTTDFGARKNNRPIILGVVYDDVNNNQFYDAGEGIPNIKVSLSQSQNTQTASAGGYGIEVDFNREYLLNFSHPSLGVINKTVQVENSNIKVDVLKSEFSNANAITQRNSEPVTTQQCLNLVQNKLSIPCVNAAGFVYKVELEMLDNTNILKGMPLLGIRSIVKKNLDKATACDVYDQHTMKAYFNCITVDSHNYRTELTMKSSVEPIFEMRTFDDSLYFF